MLVTINLIWLLAIYYAIGIIMISAVTYIACDKIAWYDIPDIIQYAFIWIIAIPVLAIFKAAHHRWEKTQEKENSL